MRGDVEDELPCITEPRTIGVSGGIVRWAASSDCDLILRPIAMLRCVQLQPSIASDRKVAAITGQCVRKARMGSSTVDWVMVVMFCLVLPQSHYP